MADEPGALETVWGPDFRNGRHDFSSHPQALAARCGTLPPRNSNALGLRRVVEPGCYETSWQWLHKLRRAMVRPGRDRLSGCVQVDETYIGGRKKGPEVQKGKLSSSKTNLDGFASMWRMLLQKAMVEPGSVIRTDGWPGYAGLPGLGYKREVFGTETSSSRCVSAQNGFSAHGAGPTHLAYLDEFTFRFNRRTSRQRGKLFYRLVQQALMVDPVEENELKATIPSEEDFDNLEF